MKKAVYTLVTAALVLSLTGCAGTDLMDGGRMEDRDPAATAAPAVSASPAVVTPDVEDGIVRDRDGIITDDDTGAETTARPNTGRKTGDNGMAASPSPSASPDTRG